MYRLIFYSGRFKGRRIAVQQGDLLIGRDPACQIDLADDDSVSRRHAVIEQRKDGVWLRDLGSMNPATVNGQPVDEVKLRPGDRIEIGRTQFEFQLVEAAVPTPRRRRSRLHILTIVAVGFILALEALFIFVFPRWQQEQIVDSDAATASTNLPGSEPASSPAPAPAPVSAPEPTPVAVTPLPAEPPPAEEWTPDLQQQVQELKQVVSGLREQVESLSTQSVTAAALAAPIPTPTPSAMSQPERAPLPEVAVAASAERPAPLDPLAVRMRELLQLAQTESRKGNWLAADQAIERLLILSPDHVPALVERARLYEKRNLLKEAGETWSRVLVLTAGTPLYNEAAAERQRLAREEARRATARGPTKSSEAAALPRRIRIQSVERERFPASRDYDEMRIVRVAMRPRLGEGRIEVDDVRVWVVFYDRVIGTGSVVPTGASAPQEPLRIETAWAAGEQKAVIANYIVPKKFRAEEEALTGQKRVYEGYRVQVWYKGELQDEDALPKSLLQETMPEMPAEISPVAAPAPARPASVNSPLRRR